MQAPSSPDPHRSRRAILALVVVTVLWGFTFVWMKQASDAGQAAFTGDAHLAIVALFMTLRFGLAAAVLGAVPSVRARLDAQAWRAGLWIGLALLVGFLLQMVGLQGVSPAVSAFLTSLYVLFTALISALRRRALPHPALFLGALLATVGAAFIGGPPHLNFDLGEWLTVACAFVFAVHILVTDTWTKRCDPMGATLACFVVVAASSLALLPIAIHLSPSVSASGLCRVAQDPAFWVPMVLSSLLATVLALSLMNLFQRDLDPVRAAIVYAIEPVWAALAGLWMGFDEPSDWLYFGGGALLAGNLIAELGPQLLRRCKAHPPPSTGA
ncbi:MAG: DMT family transporter [Planctomycetes bacterium]|nr:DMT family transporter [Planctomycetota bacterium]